MSTWTALVWNMALGSPGRNRETNVNYFFSLVQKYSVDVSLLNEAPVATLKKWRDEAVGASPVAFSDLGTIGKDYTRKGYSAAVFSSQAPEEIKDAKAKSLRDRRPEIDFAEANSRPGSWVAASVTLGEQPVCCISLYGFCDELSDASMHRSLSEISPIFSDPVYKERVLLGGDFNTFTGHRPGDNLRDGIVLDRIKAYGLEDCLEAKRDDGPLQNCPCGNPSATPCTHTLTRLIPDGDGTPYQEDYLFASKTLVGELQSCFALPPEDWVEFSDHSPIVATFEKE